MVKWTDSLTLLQTPWVQTYVRGFLSLFTADESSMTADQVCAMPGR